MLKRVCKYIYASKLVLVLGQHFAHKIPLVHQLHLIPSTFVLATKQTLLSIKNWLIMLCLDLFQTISSLDLKAVPWTHPKNLDIWNPRCLEAIYDV